MTLVALTQKVKRNLELIFINTNMIKAKKINNQKMLEIANNLRAELPSNVEDEFMINALEMQLTILKNKIAVSAS
jgi:hypothetical protein